MKVLTTPAERFENLLDYPFLPHYLKIPDGQGGKIRIHYIDEGPKDKPAVLLLHGEPTWSYLYRKMIPGLVAAGHRVLAPDLVGFGKSDKPTQKSDYSFTRHLAWIETWLKAIAPEKVTLFGQDWGSIIGLTLATLNPQFFDRIMIANGGLPDPARRHTKLSLRAMATSPEPKAFKSWQKEVATAKEIKVGEAMTILGGGLSLSSAEKAAYDAPFPDASYQAGVLVFPALVAPQSTEDKVTELFSETWTVLDNWHKPFLTAYGKGDPFLGWFGMIFRERVPGAQNQPHQEFLDATHFIQEQKALELVKMLNTFINS